jgi:hypothetical protein
MPDISLPEIKLPDVKWRDGHLRDMKLPDIDLRDRMPDVDLSKVPLPTAMRDLSMPDISLSDVRVPEVNLSKVRLPDVSLDDLKGMNVDLSGLDAKKLRDLAPFMKPAPKPASKLPWVIVAAVGGMFAGWWFATSSQTGPKVREMTARLRGRIDDWRASRSEWDDAHQVSDEPWSSPSRSDYDATNTWPRSSLPTSAGSSGDEVNGGTWPDSPEGSAAAASSGGYGGSGFEPGTATTDGGSQ